MPKSNSTIAAPLREALLECLRATTSLVRPERRHQLILVGGAASIAHSSALVTEDVDVAGPPSVLIDIWEGVSAGALNFSFEPDGKIAFDAPSQAYESVLTSLRSVTGASNGSTRQSLFSRALLRPSSLRFGVLTR